MDAERQERRENSYENHKTLDQFLTQLTSIRAQQGLTRAQIAERMNVDEQYITELESGYSSLFDGLTDYLQAVNARIEINAKATK